MEYFITSAGIPVHINDSKKDGPAILLLHGYLETLYIWEEFQELFSPKYRIISIDLPGHGLSGISSEGFSPDLSNKFIIDILDKLSIDKCYIISHSCGYYIASLFANTYPERVYSVFNIGSSVIPSSEELSFISIIRSSIEEGTFMKIASQSITKMYFNHNLRACDEKIEETVEICETHDPLALSIFFRDITSFFPDDSSSPKSAVPIYHISGKNDMFPINLPNHSFIIQDAGTNLFIERPDEVFNIISTIIDYRNSTIENC